MGDSACQLRCLQTTPTRVRVARNLFVRCNFPTSCGSQPCTYSLHFLNPNNLFPSKNTHRDEAWTCITCDTDSNSAFSLPHRPHPDPGLTSTPRKSQTWQTTTGTTTGTTTWEEVVVPQVAVVVPQVAVVVPQVAVVVPQIPASRAVSYRSKSNLLGNNR